MENRILIISQVFWPDSSSVSQHLTDLAEELIFANYRVDVIASKRTYENPKIPFPKEGVYRGINIRRLRHTGFGKSSPIGRAIDFLTFNIHMLFRLFLLKKNQYELIIGLTTPPLLSFVGILTSKIKKIKFCYWAMDLQPELAIVAGYLKQNSLISRTGCYFGDYIFRNSDLIITLDKYMAGHIIERGGREGKIKIVPVWPVMDQVYEGKRLSNPFRLEHGFGKRIVIMYSGNHSVIHPLDTLLDAALKVRHDERFLFVFIGGGVRRQDVANFKNKNNLTNILQLPYQPRDKIHLSLGSADLHVVIHGSGCTGYTHPNKMYGAMYIGRPILYIGPRVSHITDALLDCPGNILVEHGQSELIVKRLISFAEKNNKLNIIGETNREIALRKFSKDKLLNSMISEINLLLGRGV